MAMTIAGILVVVLGLICWLAQTLVLFTPRVAAKLGVGEPEEDLATKTNRGHPSGFLLLNHQPRSVLLCRYSSGEHPSVLRKARRKFAVSL